ncbi:MAG: hypothetical protein CVU89_02625 [Firmicutes bacterium HGW-Firmicutes-14]|nr:MAG: hypothetical protein CVU89_02625 [Firmicutes bacterium HGW-Firmicutes-14]
MRIYDHTDQTLTAEKTIYSITKSGIYNVYYDGSESGYVDVLLKRGHVYSITLIYDVASEGYGQAVGMADFESEEFDGDKRLVYWNWVELQKNT